MEDAEFEVLPFGSEGLWRKLMRESRAQAALEDIAAAVSFLADERASFITGQVLTCDGGFIL